MTWQEAFWARLVAAPSVAALVATYTPSGASPRKAIFWVQRAQGSPLPAIVLTTISDEREQHMNGFVGFDEARVQIDIYASTYAQTVQIAEAVKDAIAPRHTANDVRFDRSFIDTIRDLPAHSGTVSDVTEFIHRKSMDILVHHATA